MNPCVTDGQHMPSRVIPVYAEDLAASTSLVALPANADKHYQLFGYIIHTDTAGTYTLAIGGVTVAKYFFAANSGIALNMAPLYFSNGIVNQAVTLSKPSGANTTITTLAGLV